MLASEAQHQVSGLVPPAALHVLYSAQFALSTGFDLLSDVVRAPVIGELTAAGLALQLGAIAVFGLGGLVFTADAEGVAPYEAGTSTYDPKMADAFYRCPRCRSNRRAAVWPATPSQSPTDRRSLPCAASGLSWWREGW